MHLLENKSVSCCGAMNRVSDGFLKKKFSTFAEKPCTLLSTTTQRVPRNKDSECFEIFLNLLTRRLLRRPYTNLIFNCFLLPRIFFFIIFSFVQENISVSYQLTCREKREIAMKVEMCLMKKKIKVKFHNLHN